MLLLMDDVTSCVLIININWFDVFVNDVTVNYIQLSSTTKFTFIMPPVRSKEWNDVQVLHSGKKNCLVQSNYCDKQFWVERW